MSDPSVDGIEEALRALVPGEERLTRADVVVRSGISEEYAVAFWRALGFPDVPPDERVFTEVDVEALTRVKQLIDSEIVRPEIALQNTRVMGRAAAQVAAALVDTVRARTGTNIEAAPPALLANAPLLLEDLDRWIVYVWRRHFAAEAKRAALQAATQEAGTSVVGFADLVGFTGISQQLDEETLAQVVSAFEATAVEIVGSRGGRVVKMIGDEVMFEAPTALDGAEIALDLVEAFATSEELPDVRVGLAFGPATRSQGDLFGTAPNLASRLVDEAYPGSVLVSETIHDALDDAEDYVFRSVAPRKLKGLGRTRFWVLRRAGETPDRPMWRILPRLAEAAMTYRKEAE